MYNTLAYKELDVAEQLAESQYWRHAMIHVRTAAVYAARYSAELNNLNEDDLYLMTELLAPEIHSEEVVNSEAYEQLCDYTDLLDDVGEDSYQCSGGNSRVQYNREKYEKLSSVVTQFLNLFSTGTRPVTSF